jgi:hypothetical protein
MTQHQFIYLLIHRAVGKLIRAFTRTGDLNNVVSRRFGWANHELTRERLRYDGGIYGAIFLGHQLHLHAIYAIAVGVNDELLGAVTMKTV